MATRPPEMGPQQEVAEQLVKTKEKCEALQER